MKDCKDALRKVRKKGETVEARVNECSAKDEKCNDALSQLENRVGEVLESNQVLKAQIEGVGRQVQQLQQSLPQALHQVVQQEIKGLQGWLDGKLNYLFPNITVAAPISYVSGTSVGAEDTTSYQIAPLNWGSAGSQTQGGASLGQPLGSNRGGIVGHQLNQGANYTNFLVEEQVRQPTVWKGPAVIEAAGHNGGVITLPIPRMFPEDQGYQHLPLEGSGVGNEPRQPRAHDQLQAGPKDDRGLSEVLEQAVQQAGLGEGYQEAVVQPGPSGSGGPAGLATTTPQPQEGPRKDQGKEVDSAKKRSDSHSTDRTKRAREEPLGEPEKLQRGGGHTAENQGLGTRTGEAQGMILGVSGGRGCLRGRCSESTQELK